VVPELSFWSLPPFSRAHALDDLFDVELENIAPAELALARSRFAGNTPSGARIPAAPPESPSGSRRNLCDRLFDSLVNGTQTEAMWTNTTMGPAGSAPRDCATPLIFASLGLEGPTEGRARRLLDTAGGRGWRSE